MTPIQATSIGHALDIASADVGLVHGAYAHAVNLEMRGDLWTLLAADRSDLPFGIRSTLQGLAVLGLRRGDPVSVRSGYVGIGRGSTRVVVDCRAAARWVPAVPDSHAPGLEQRLRIVAAATSDCCWHGSAEMAHDVMSALGEPDALGEVLARVVGRGPGLTPSGDDVLVGILSVLTSPMSLMSRPGPVESLVRLLRPLLPTTTDVSGHMLRQAANGYFGRDVRELSAALIGGRLSEQLAASVRRVVESGATSGADACAGMLAAAQLFFLRHDETAAA